MAPSILINRYIYFLFYTFQNRANNLCVYFVSPEIFKNYLESTNSFPTDDAFQHESYPCNDNHFFINTNL